MVRRILLLVLMLSPGLVRAQEPAASPEDFASQVQEQFREVGRLWQARDIERAVAILEELAAREELRTLDWAWTGTLYNLACGCALLGRNDQALSHLREATEAGFADIAQLERDPDLDGIRTMPGFLDLMRKLKVYGRLWENPVLNTPYREDLSWEEKVAGLSKLWAEVKYNFVFFDREPVANWDSLYVEYLSRVQRTTSTLEYYWTLREMTAHLRDGHTGINLPRELYDETSFRPAIRTRLIEDRVLVVEVGADLRSSTNVPLHPGLEVIRVDDLPVRLYAEERILPYVRASTPQSRDVWAYDYDLLLGRKGSDCELELKGNGEQTYTVRLARDIPVMVRPDSEPHVRWLAGGIAHLTLKSFADNSVVAGFDSLFAGLESSEALILDLRDNGGGNSSVGYALLGYFTDRSFSIIRCSGRDYSPLRRAMGLGERWREEGPGTLPANRLRHYGKPVVVLISPRTGSAAEDFCAAFGHLQRGKLIGEATAGSTGQPLVIGLPGGGNATVCTVRCVFPDGDEFVGMGIRPDIEVRPTVEDTKADRDTVLEAALRFLRLSDAGAKERTE
jgi:carboxyl-terminal processing protease